MVHECSKKGDKQQTFFGPSKLELGFVVGIRTLPKFRVTNYIKINLMFVHACTGETMERASRHILLDLFKRRVRLRSDYKSFDMACT